MDTTQDKQLPTLPVAIQNHIYNIYNYGSYSKDVWINLLDTYLQYISILKEADVLFTHSGIHDYINNITYKGITYNNYQSNNKFKSIIKKDNINVKDYLLHNFISNITQWTEILDIKITEAEAILSIKDVIILLKQNNQITNPIINHRRILYKIILFNPYSIKFTVNLHTINDNNINYLKLEDYPHIISVKV